MTKVTPFQSLWGRFALLALPLMILLGTFLLALPAALLVPINLIDLLFTATSASCVCGLQTVDLQSFTLFGQTIIFWLMQIGGLGIITLSLMLVFVIAEVKMSTHAVAEDILEIHKVRDIKRALLFIVALTVTVETLGAL